VGDEPTAVWAQRNSELNQLSRSKKLLAILLWVGSSLINIGGHPQLKTPFCKSLIVGFKNQLKTNGKTNGKSTDSNHFSY
jgi:hypothetical protein